MAKVFLDTNYFIDAVHRKPEVNILDSLENHKVYCSTLSFHIYCYAYKIKIPNQKINRQKEKFYMVDYSEKILDNALNGPTKDLEDNIQLHSAVEIECDYFLTSDQKLLDMKFFGKAKIVSSLI